MMKLHYRPDTGEIRHAWTAADADQRAPESGTAVLEFDPATNPDLVAGLVGQLPGVQSQDHAVVDGVLHRKGEPVPIAPPAADPWPTLLAAFDKATTINADRAAVRAILVYLHDRQNQS